MIRIARVERSSPAHRAGIRRGWRICSIEGEQVRDSLDLAYHSSGEVFQLRLMDGNGSRRTRTVHVGEGERLGVVPADDPVTRCACSCVFCFVRQNPPGLRKALYVRDDDFRLSFTTGSYITLTNLSESDFERIEKQRLSPLYVSVHSTDETARCRLLRVESTGVMEKLRRLLRAGISLHTQIVVVPGYNDERIFERTLDDLWSLGSRVESVGVVPVGLTEHRERLTKLGPVSPRLSRSLLRTIRQWQVRARKGREVDWVYAADELYLLANRPVPKAWRYDGYPQIENGIGLSRDVIDRARAWRGRLPTRLPRRMQVLLLTGTLAAPLLRERVLPILRGVGNLQVDVVPVANTLFGSSVTVSGLLGGEDLANAARASRGEVLLPPEALNADGLTLDDWKVVDISERAKKAVRVGSYDVIGSIIAATGASTEK